VVRFVLAFAVGTLAGAVLAALVTARGRRRQAPSRTDLWTPLRTELERSRRYDHHFALVRLWTRWPDRSVEDLPLETVVRRRTDHAWRVGDSIYLLLPETTLPGAQQHVARLRARPGGRDLAARVACFPRDGLTTDALLWALGDTPTYRRARRSSGDEEAVS
jgi:hypothetical protein